MCDCPTASDADVTGWWTSGGNTGNTRAVSSPAFEPPGTVAWQHDMAGARAPAVSDGTVYFKTRYGRIRALDAADGSLKWINGDVNTRGTPTVVDDTVYLDGGRIQALDAATGDVRWERESAMGTTYHIQLVAYGMVFVTVNEFGYSDAPAGPLYALDREDGSVCWKCETVSLTGTNTPYWYSKVVELDDTLYATLQPESLSTTAIAELDPRTGERLWASSDWVVAERAEALAAADGRVYISGRVGYGLTVFDTRTRSAGRTAQIRGKTTKLAVAEGIAVATTKSSLYATTDFWSRSPDPTWEQRGYSGLGIPNIVNDTVVVSDERYDRDDELLGFDLETGCEKWRFVLDEERVGRLFNNHVTRGPPVICDDTVYISTHEGFTALRPNRDGGTNRGDERVTRDEDDGKTDESDSDETDRTEDVNADENADEVEWCA